LQDVRDGAEFGVGVDNDGKIVMHFDPALVVRIIYPAKHKLGIAFLADGQWSGQGVKRTAQLFGSRGWNVADHA